MKRFQMVMGTFLCATLFFGEQGCADKPEIPSTKGEKITYAIRKMNVKAGEATLEFNGEAKLDSRDVYLITFRADGLNFYDQEKIYIDPKTYLPVKVDRDLNIWGKKEKILEEYLPQEGIVRITKMAGGKTSQQIIRKKGNIDNIYCFIYRYRKLGKFKLGDVLSLNLPTQDVNLTMDEVTNVKAAGNDYTTYYMKSDPPKYQVWFDAGPKKIPLRINGAIGFGNTTMVMTGYQEK